MGLFDAKYCDICGEKISLMGNRKLEDGNMCKNCAAKLSPFLSGRRHTTLDSIKQHLEYREQNKQRVAAFNPTLTLGNNTKVYVDQNTATFAVSSARDWRSTNPDIIDLSQVSSVYTEAEEHKKEIYRKDSEGHNVSFNPKRYEYSYEFTTTINVNSPYFDEIKFELTSMSNRPKQRGGMDYNNFEQMGMQIQQALTGMNGGMGMGMGNMNMGMNGMGMQGGMQRVGMQGGMGGMQGGMGMNGMGGMQGGMGQGMGGMSSTMQGGIAGMVGQVASAAMNDLAGNDMNSQMGMQGQMGGMQGGMGQMGGMPQQQMQGGMGQMGGMPGQQMQGGMGQMGGMPQQQMQGGMGQMGGMPGQQMQGGMGQMGGMPQQMQGGMPGQQMPGGMPGQMPGGMPGGMPGQWICDCCGTANTGDVCTACANPRPM